MTNKTETLLSEALTLTPEERALVAHFLISSLDEPTNEESTEKWITLAHSRLLELKTGKVNPVSWNNIKRKIKS